MNSPKTIEKSLQREGTLRADRRRVVQPALDGLIKAICADARTEPLKYALRSDTGHDGE